MGNHWFMLKIGVQIFIKTVFKIPNLYFDIKNLQFVAFFANCLLSLTILM